MTNQTSSESKTVLLSYSHDDLLHKKWVRRLADKLLEKGVSVWLDQYDMLPGDSITHFMEEKVTESDKVVLILTPVYKEKADNRKGGAGYEHAMVSLDLYENQLKRKFIPVIRRGNWELSSPKILKTLLSIDMTDDNHFEDQFNELYHALFDRSAHQKPSLGRGPVFENSERWPTEKGQMDTEMGAPITDGAADTKPQLKPRIDVLGAPAAGDVMTDVIDQKAAMNRLGMSRFAKWTFQFEIPALSRKIALDLQLMMTQAAPHAENGLNRFPAIFNEHFRKGHRPVFRYERDFQSLGVTNLFESEVLLIDAGLIHYECCEITSMDPLITHLMTPITTAIYLAYILRFISKNFPTVVVTSLIYRFASSHPALFNVKNSPIKPDGVYGRQTMGIFDPPQQGKITILLGDDRNIFEVFRDVYRLFSAENTNALRPILDIDRASFDNLVSALGLAKP